MKASRSASTPRGYDRAAIGSSVRVLLLAATCASAAACQPQLTLDLVRADDLLARPPFVKLLVRELAEPQADVFGPFSVGAFPDEQLAPVPPGSPFFVDVIGCPTGVGAECESLDSFIARGCTEFLTLERDSAVVVEVEVHSAAVGATLCPPETP